MIKGINYKITELFTLQIKTYYIWIGKKKLYIC